MVISVYVKRKMSLNGWVEERRRAGGAWVFKGQEEKKYHVGQGGGDK